MEQHQAEHSIGYGTYVLVWLGLLVFTGLTVSVSGINLEALTVTVALLIAGFKTFLVMNYFMHLKYEPILFKLMVFLVIITFAIFLSLTFLDILFR